MNFTIRGNLALQTKDISEFSNSAIQLEKFNQDNSFKRINPLQQVKGKYSLLGYVRHLV